MVRVHHDEGVANRIDPESCAVARQGNSEALTGECTGQPLSRGGPGDRQEVDGARWSNPKRAPNKKCFTFVARRPTPDADDLGEH